MRRITLREGNLTLAHSKVLGFIEKTVTPFGNSGKVDCPKQFIGKRVYLIVCKD